MKFGIVGPISRDRILLATGETVQKYGAIAYPALALAKLLEGTADEVVCLSHVAAEDVAAVTQLLQHPNIRLAVSDGSQHGAAIELSYVDSAERISHQTGTMTPVTSTEIPAIADCDYILLMPLNETDIGLEWVRELRRQSDAVIFLDLHGLVTGLREDGQRYRKQWEHSEAWLASIDILKMNDKEAPWASGRCFAANGDYVAYAVAMIRRGLSACWITFGDRSSLVAWRRNERILWANVPVIQLDEVIDTTGCGDSAAGGFIFGYAKTHQHPLMAVIAGNTIGSIKASFSETDAFPTRPEVRDMIAAHYRPYLQKLLDQLLFENHLVVQEVRSDGASDAATGNVQFDFSQTPDGPRPSDRQ